MCAIGGRQRAGSVGGLGGGGGAGGGVEGEAVEAGGVFPEDLALDGLVDAGHFAGDEVLAVGPDAVGVGEVGAPHDVVLAEDVDEADADGVALVGREALAAPVLRRLHLELEGPGTGPPTRGPCARGRRGSSRCRPRR